MMGCQNLGFSFRSHIFTTGSTQEIMSHVTNGRLEGVRGMDLLAPWLLPLCGSVLPVECVTSITVFLSFS